MPDVLFNLLLLSGAVLFSGVFIRAWRVTRAQRRNAGTDARAGDAVVRDGSGEPRG